jgi:hypothetical protein
MASIISTKTSGGGGIAVTGDTSGVLELQSNNGTTAVTIDASQNVGIGTSSPVSLLQVGSTATSDNTLTIASANNTAAQINLLGDSSATFGTNIKYEGNGNYFAISTNNAGTLTERMRIDSSGNVLVGTTSSGGFGFRVNGSAQIVSLLYVPGVYGQTTASAANVHVATDGNLFRSTSSIKYKNDVQNAIHGLDKVMELRPVTYKGINDGDTIFGGLIAEEVHEAGLTEFVQYSEDGSPDALAYGQMVSLAFKAIQEQQAIITDLKARIEVLEGAQA